MGPTTWAMDRMTTTRGARTRSWEYSTRDCARLPGWATIPMSWSGMPTAGSCRGSAWSASMATERAGGDAARRRRASQRRACGGAGRPSRGGVFGAGGGGDGAVRILGDARPQPLRPPPPARAAARRRGVGAGRLNRLTREVPGGRDAGAHARPLSGAQVRSLGFQSGQ